MDPLTHLSLTVTQLPLTSLRQIPSSAVSAVVNMDLGAGSDMAARPTAGAGAVASNAAAAPAAAQAGTNAATAAQNAMLADIGKNGVYAWAQDHKFAALKANIRSQVLADRQLDESSMAKLDPAQRASAENSVQAETSQRMRQAMQQILEGRAQAAAQNGEPARPMVVDIAV